MERRLAAILAADLAGYTALMGADEAGTLRRLTDLRRQFLEPLINEHRGRVVKLMGDGLLVEFASVVDAVTCALAWQNGMVEREATTQEGRWLEFRIAINLGDVIVEGDDIYGDGVNIAARLEGLAEPGEIYLSGDAYRQARGKVDAIFEDLGERDLKNVAEPVRVYRVASDSIGTARAAPGRNALPLPDEPSIAVLPFENMSGDPGQDYFSDGITEDITTELSRFGELFVIARNTAFTYKGRIFDVRDVARELGVHFILEGSVRRAGDRIRINAQLIDGLNGNHLWADRYNGSAEEVFDLQDQVTCKVVSAIVPHIDEAELAHIRRGDRLFDTAQDLAWQAYDEMRQAIGLGQSALLQAAKAKALKAIELNERCSRSYLTVCIAIWLELLWQVADDPEAMLVRLKEAADRFVSLSPTSHSAHYCHGISNMMAGHNEAAALDLRHSVELNPNDASVLSLLADVEVQLDNLDDAKAIATRAIRLNPLDTTVGTAYLALAQIAFVEDDSHFRHWAEKAILAQPRAPARRVLMIAYAAEIGDHALLAEHLEILNRFAPRLLPRLLRGDVEFFPVPRHREKILGALRKAGLQE